MPSNYTPPLHSTIMLHWKCFISFILELQIRDKLFTFIENPGRRPQTNKRKDMSLTYDGEQGKGLFFQYDGEARYVFGPLSKFFSMHVRSALNISIVLGPLQNPKLTVIPKNMDDSNSRILIAGEGEE